MYPLSMNFSPTATRFLSGFRGTRVALTSPMKTLKRKPPADDGFRIIEETPDAPPPRRPVRVLRSYGGASHHSGFSLLATVLAVAIGFATTTYLRGWWGGSDDAKKYNNALVALTQRLESAGFNLGSALSGQLAQQHSDAPACRKALNDAVAAYNDVVRDANALKVPSGSKAAALHAAFKEFLRGQGEIITVHFAELTSIAENRTLTAQQKQSKAAEIIARVSPIEQNALARLREAQSAFAREHGARIQ